MIATLLASLCSIPIAGPKRTQPKATSIGTQLTVELVMIITYRLTRPDRQKGNEGMAQFVIQTHGRLQEAVAHEKGYFAEAGLRDYAMKTITLPPAQANRPFGAYQSYEEGSKASVSCACHWTVNIAAANGHGKLWAGCYSVSPAGIFVAEQSAIRRLADLGDVAVDVGYQSGSHYATLQALETRLGRDRIKLDFTGSPNTRLHRLVSGETHAATLFGAQLYIAEQLGFRRIADVSFMIAAMVPDGTDVADVARYYAALRRAQADIDLDHQRYTHYFMEDVPEAHRDRIDTAAFGPGERLVFEPYSAEIFDKTQDWVSERGIFDAAKLHQRDYQSAAVMA
jgi:NitT/TauT family transport system substrate-binding protein